MYGNTRTFCIQRLWTLCLVAVLLMPIPTAGALCWEKIISFDAYPDRTGADRQGNIYVQGTFSGIATFGSLVLINNSDEKRGFLVKYTSDGTALWAEPFGDEYAVAADMAVAPSGNVYVAGLFHDSLYLADTTVVAAGLHSYIIGYDPEGKRRWLRLFEGAYVGEIAAGGAEKICAGVHYPFDDPAGRKAALLLYSESGDEEWRQELAPDGTCVIDAVDMDVAGRMAVAGRFGNRDLVIGDTVLPGGLPDRRLFFTALFGGDGILQWARQGNYTNRVAEPPQVDIAIDRDGNVIAVGGVTDTLYIDEHKVIGPAAENRFAVLVMRYSVSGTIEWLHSFGGRGVDRALSAAVDRNGNTVVTGRYFDTLALGDVILRENRFAHNCFIAVLDQSGAVSRASVVARVGLQDFAAACDSTGNIFVCGSALLDSATVDGVPFGKNEGFVLRAAPATAVREIPDYRQQFSVYPNPARSGIVIVPPAAFGAKVELLDLSGRIVYSLAPAPADTGTALRIPLGGVAPGLYLLSVVAPDGGRTTTTFVVAR